MPTDWWARVPVRVSSRGRMVVPPLCFWKGERIRDIHNCFVSQEDKFCNCLELDGTKMLNTFLEKVSIKRELDMDKISVTSTVSSLHCRTRIGQHRSVPVNCMQTILKERLSECNLPNARCKRKSSEQKAEKTPPRKRRRTVGTMLTMRPVKNGNHRKNSTKNSTKDNGLIRSIHRDLSRSFKNDEHLCENDDSMKWNKKLLCCLSCDDERKCGKRANVLNSLDTNLKTKYLKIYPNLWDVRVELVDLRYWWHGKAIQTLGAFPLQTIKVENTDDSVTSGGYWLRQVKLAIPPSLSPGRRVLRERKCRKASLGSFHAHSDCNSKKMMNMGTPTKGGYLETDFQIRDIRVVLSPLSSSQLKLLQRGKLQPKTLKNFSRNQKVSNRHYSENVHKRKSTNSSSPARKRTSKTAKCRKVLSNNKNSPGMKTGRKKSPSVFGDSHKNRKRNSCKKNWKTRKHSSNTDMFEDPLYACLLSSSDSDYFQPISLDHSQTRCTEKQSTPLSKYLDFRDESSDWVSPKSTPTRFHTKGELKRKVSRVRRMRAEKLRKNRQKKVKKEPEMFPPSSDNDSVEELSAFEQLKRALGLMDKVQKKICEDRYSEEEPYFGDSDD